MRDALLLLVAHRFQSLWMGNNKPVGRAKCRSSGRTTGDIYNCFDCVKDHGT